MRKARKNTATRQVIHIVGEGLTELFYFSHLKKILGYRYSISPRLFENNSIEKIDKKIKELLDEDVFVICVFDADVSRRSDAENKKMVSLKKKYENNPNVILCRSKPALTASMRIASAIRSNVPATLESKIKYSNFFKYISHMFNCS